MMRWTIGLFLCLICSSMSSAQPFSLSEDTNVGSGSASRTYSGDASVGYSVQIQVHLTANGLPSVPAGGLPVFLRATSANVIFRDITVMVTYDAAVPANRRFASLAIDVASGGSIALVEQVVHVFGGGANQDGDLKIAGINIQGNLPIGGGQTVPGRLGDPTNGLDDVLIAADYGNLSVRGDVYADVLVEPATYAGIALPGDILRLESTGRLYGNVLTDPDLGGPLPPRGRIGTINFASGHIGDATTAPPVTPVIYSNGWVQLIDARTITANIAVEAGNSDCQCLRRIRANAGSITGQLAVSTLGVASQVDSGLFVVNG